jgi:hypothetical protein
MLDDKDLDLVIAALSFQLDLVDDALRHDEMDEDTRADAVANQERVRELQTRLITERFERRVKAHQLAITDRAA